MRMGSRWLQYDDKWWWGWETEAVVPSLRVCRCCSHADHSRQLHTITHEMGSDLSPYFTFVHWKGWEVFEWHEPIDVVWSSQKAHQMNSTSSRSRRRTSLLPRDSVCFFPLSVSASFPSDCPSWPCSFTLILQASKSQSSWTLPISWKPLCALSVVFRRFKYCTNSSLSTILCSFYSSPSIM